MPIPLFYLTDSSSQVWELGVTDSGAYTTTAVIGSGVSFILLQDSFSSQVWKLTVLTTGALQITAFSGTGLSGLLLESPSSLFFVLFVANAAISTISTAFQTILTGGGFQDPLGNPYKGGRIIFNLSRPATINSILITTGNISSLLDNNGNVISLSAIPNLSLTPDTTFYDVRVYASNGQLVWYTSLVIPETYPSVNLGTIVPQQ